MTPELSLKLTFDWFKTFYANKKNRERVIEFTIDQFKFFLNKIKYF